MIQDFQDNLILTDQIENLSGWITLVHIGYSRYKNLNFEAHFSGPM